MDRYSCEAVNVMWGDLYDSWVAGNEKKLPIWYKASDVADLAKRMQDVICAYEPFRVMAEMGGRKMPKIFDSMYMENFDAELEQIVKESS